MFMRNDDTENSAAEYFEVHDLEVENEASLEIDQVVEPEPEPAPVAAPEGLTVIEFQANVNGYRRGDQAALPHLDADRWVNTGMAVKV